MCQRGAPWWLGFEGGTSGLGGGGLPAAVCIGTAPAAPFLNSLTRCASALLINGNHAGGYYARRQSNPRKSRDLCTKKNPNELGDKQGKNSSKDMPAFCFSIQSEMGGLFLLFPRLLFFLFFFLPSLPPCLTHAWIKKQVSSLPALRSLLLRRGV